MHIAGGPDMLPAVGDDLLAGHAHRAAHGDDAARDRALLRLGVVDGPLACDVRVSLLHQHVVRRLDHTCRHVVLHRIRVELRGLTARAGCERVARQQQRAAERRREGDLLFFHVTWLLSQYAPCRWP